MAQHIYSATGKDVEDERSFAGGWTIIDIQTNEPYGLKMGAYIQESRVTEH